MKILIVEDNYSFQTIYKNVLEYFQSRGHEIEFKFVESFREFKIELELFIPDIVWTDHCLVGRGNGGVVAWHLYQFHPGPNIPCVGISSLREGDYPPGTPRFHKNYSIRKLYSNSKIWLETGVEPDWYN